jgi:hypothetical protein|tara:strand:- start:2989 stop:3330 length:342 start_codon:yes stop_codon:yes gene_type:complete
MVILNLVYGKNLLTKKLMKKEIKFHCYGNSETFTENICAKDECKWLISCKVLSGVYVDMFEYSLVELLYGTITYTELVNVLMKNYSISKNAAKLAITRWKRIEKLKDKDGNIC